MKKKIRLLIADDHSLILEGIRSLLSGIDGIEIIAEALNGTDAVEKTLTAFPNVVFMDLSMPGTGGIEACSIITKKFPEVKVIALTQHEDDVYIHHFLQAGGSGYMLKNSSRDEFLLAIKSVLSGKNYFSAQLAERFISGHFYRKDKEAQAFDEPVFLTKREKEIMKLIAEGLSNLQTSERLHISLRTVETRRRNIMQKLNLRNSIDLVKYAFRHGIIGLSE